MRTAVIVLTTLLLASCSNVSQTPQTQTDEGPVSIITGKTGGIKLSDLGGIKNNAGSAMPVNAILWRAALDIAALLPISDVDTFGGTIVTEWYSLPENPNERIKLTIFVVGRELRSDAIRVVVNVQKRDGLQGNWGNNFRDLEFSRRLEDLVLNRAREIRAESLTDITE